MQPSDTNSGTYTRTASNLDDGNCSVSIGSTVLEVARTTVYTKQELDILADVVALLRNHRRRRLAKESA